jgi:hypothetical protein
MFLVTPATVLNPAALETRHIPRRLLGRGLLIPRRGAGLRLILRLVVEVEMLRDLAALLPFVLAALIWRDSALAIAQAPLLMFLVIYGVEMRFFRLTPAARQALLAPGEADRGQDLLRARALSVLTRIAARRGLTQGGLHLVIEQSDLVRIAPLTLVSVQSEDGPQLLSLDREEEALIRETLFQPPLTERALHRITLASDEQIHDIAFDPRAVSAHARLAALMAQA